CYVTSNSTDEIVLIGAGILALDGAVIADGSAGTGDASGSGSDAEGGASPSDATMVTGGDAGDATMVTGGDAGDETTSQGVDGVAETGTVSPCPTPQTTFGSVAQGDSNSNFTSGVGVRTANQLLIFSGYSGPVPSGFDAGSDADAGTVNIVYVQAFDPATGNSLGAATPLFAAFNGGQFTIDDVSIAPTGQIALLHSQIEGDGGGKNALYASFLSSSPAASLNVQRTVRLDSVPIASPHSTWLASSQEFVLSWCPLPTITIKVKKFLPDGRTAGGDPNQANQQLYTSQHGVGTSGGFLGVAQLFYIAPSSSGDAYRYPYLTIFDEQGAQRGSPMALSTSVGPHWETVGGTATGFVNLFDNGGAVYAVFVPTSGDAGATGDAGDAGFPGFSFASTATTAHAISDDTGGTGGVGAVLLESSGATFLYVKSDGTSHILNSTVLNSATGAQVAITNYHGSFAVSLYDGTKHATQVIASGCQ
ncbi:MAG TPA: hypothetical protein VGY54_21530, partial [Polyangiaceae bacterium]|nr:hypothetical protein [Polyangiaceae bacterium]